MEVLLILVNITCCSLLMIVSKIIQLQYNRFFNDTKELCPILCPFLHQMHFVVCLIVVNKKVFQQQQTLSFKPLIDSVLSMYKCSFSLLISKQGFKKSSEIALLSTALQRCSFSPPQLLCLHTICQSLGATCYFIPATVFVEASGLLTRSTFYLYSIFFLPSSYSTQV